jgi:hypothetical protein
MPKLAPYAVKDMAEGGVVPEATYRLRLHKFEYNDPHNEEWKKAHPNSEAKDPFLQLDAVIQDDVIKVVENGEEKDVMVFGRHLFIPLTFKKGADFMLRMLLTELGKEEDWELVDQYGEPHWDELLNGEVLGVVTVQPERSNPKKPGEVYPARNNVKKFMAIL